MIPEEMWVLWGKTEKLHPVPEGPAHSFTYLPPQILTAGCV